jgi:cytochrome c-type biogenesis protein CcmI
MSASVLWIAAAALAVVAAWALLAPRRRAVDARATARASTGVSDAKRTALRQLRDLEDDHAAGLVDDDAYGRMRASLLRQAAAALDVAEPMGDAGEHSAAPGRATSTRKPRLAPALAGVLVAVLVAGGAGVLLSRSTRQRGAGETISGGLAASAAVTSPRPTTSQRPPTDRGIGVLQRRVAAHPEDLSAWLDLAAADMSAGRPDDATAAYLFVLGAQPDNAAAGTGLALILFRDGKIDDAYAAASHVVQASPTYPDAYYARGLIELMAQHRPRAARGDLRHYLTLAPRGEHTGTVRTLLGLLARGGTP